MYVYLQSVLSVLYDLHSINFTTTGDVSECLSCGDKLEPNLPQVPIPYHHQRLEWNRGPGSSGRVAVGDG